MSDLLSIFSIGPRGGQAKDLSFVPESHTTSSEDRVLTLFNLWEKGRKNQHSLDIFFTLAYASTRQRVREKFDPAAGNNFPSITVTLAYAQTRF